MVHSGMVQKLIKGKELDKFRQRIFMFVISDVTL